MPSIEIYASAWHHPGIAFLGNALLLLFFGRVVPKELRVFTAVSLFAISLDAYLTGALSPWKTGGVAQAISIFFVIAGDLRYFYLLEKKLPLATALAFVVPLTQTAIMEWIYPAPFTSKRVIFLSYEALFVLFASVMWWLRHSRGADRFRTGLFAYEIVQYVLWASIDVVLLSGAESLLALRIVPNTLYYAGFLWFVVLSRRRFS